MAAARWNSLRPILSGARLLHTCAACRKDLPQTASPGDVSGTSSIGKPSGRQIAARDSRNSSLKVVMYTREARMEKLVAAKTKSRMAVARVEEQKQIEKKNFQSKLLEKYCGSKSYSPLVPYQVEKKLVRRARIERQLAGIYRPVRLRPHSHEKKVEDPYDVHHNIIVNHQVPLTDDQKYMIKLEENHYVPEEFDEKNMPPNMQKPIGEQFLHARIVILFAISCVVVSYYTIFIQAEMFEEDLKDFRKWFRGWQLEVFPLDFLNDDVIAEFQQRELDAFEKHLRSREYAEKHQKELEKEAQEAYQDVVNFIYPTSRHTSPTLSIPK